mmetsp:Transcript_13895/g.44475  ORF Transcript_13895/g.44475 Transcript_13895/m.44475 type:complete len:153 (-) Transcript_13895:1070-1528(-)
MQRINDGTELAERASDLVEGDNSRGMCPIGRPTLFDTQGVLEVLKSYGQITFGAVNVCHLLQHNRHFKARSMLWARFEFVASLLKLSPCLLESVLLAQNTSKLKESRCNSVVLVAFIDDPFDCKSFAKECLSSTEVSLETADACHADNCLRD